MSLDHELPELFTTQTPREVVAAIAKNSLLAPLGEFLSRPTPFKKNPLWLKLSFLDFTKEMSPEDIKSTLNADIDPKAVPILWELDEPRLTAEIDVSPTPPLIYFELVLPDTRLAYIVEPNNGRYFQVFCEYRRLINMSFPLSLKDFVPEIQSLRDCKVRIFSGITNE